MDDNRIVDFVLFSRKKIKIKGEAANKGLAPS